MLEATSAYRRAFKLDAHIDRAYHRATMAAAKEAEKVVEPAPHSLDGLEFAFARTLQVGPDYTASSTASAKTHPSSTSRLVDSLVTSFGRHPFVREPDVPEDGAERTARLIVDPPPDPDATLRELAFIADDEALGVAINRLPAEIVTVILRHLVLPESVAAFPRIDPLEARFALVSRKARMASLDPAIWRAACERVYRAPHALPEGDSAEALVRRAHALDWRRMWIEQPRLRSDGCFIAVLLCAPAMLALR